ncbi:MAG: hypothetical protein WDM88_04200 [Galbitalea sp.]
MRPVVVSDNGLDAIAIRSMVYPRAVLRPPHRRRCGRRALPGRGQRPLENGSFEGKPRHLVRAVGSAG